MIKYVDPAVPADSPFQSVNICDRDALEQSDDQQWDAARKVVEQRENVVPGPMSEHERQHEASGAGDPCKWTG